MAGTAYDAELRVAAETLQLAAEAAEIGIWDLDLTTNVLTWSDRTRAAFGISPDVPVSMDDFYGCLHPDDAEATAAAFAAAIDPARRTGYDVVYRTIGKEDGVVRSVEARGRGLFDADGRCVRAVGTAIDITARRHVEERLRESETRLAESEAKFRAITDSIEQMVWSTQPDGHHDYFNQRWYDFTGVPPGSTDGAGWNEMFHPEDQERAWGVWRHCLATGEPYHIEYRLRHRSGQYRWVLGRALPVRDGRGAIVRWYGTCTDIHELAETRAALARSRAELEQRVAERTAELLQAEESLRQAQKMEAVGQLTGGIAHDFNNMLAVVIGSLDLLGRRLGDADPRAKRYVDSATEGARRAAQLTQRLLAFARQQPLRPERLDVNRLVSSMSDLLRHSLGGEVRLETVLAGGLWPVHADPNQLESAILNLAVNARDAMPDGGRLTIETQNIDLDDTRGAAHPGVPDGQYVRIAVIDTGVGIPSEAIAKVFDPFFTTKSVGKGTGLGLSQVYGFVRQSGGHVKVCSEPGAGTTMSIYLPRHMAATDEQPAVQLSAALPGGSRRELVLVVEDEAAVRRFSCEALADLGYRVLEADGAAAAMTLIERHPDIDLLFTDVVMPEVNGRKLAEMAGRARPGLRVLFTSGYSRNAVVHDGVLDPGVQLLGKPFSVEELARKVRAVLDADTPRAVSASAD